LAVTSEKRCGLPAAFVSIRVLSLRLDMMNIQHSTGTRFNTCVGGKLHLFPPGVQFGEVGDPSVDLQGHPLVKPLVWISTSSTSFKLVLL
jgi:hypothetical protein